MIDLIISDLNVTFWQAEKHRRLYPEPGACSGLLRWCCAAHSPMPTLAKEDIDAMEQWGMIHLRPKGDNHHHHHQQQQQHQTWIISGYQEHFNNNIQPYMQAFLFHFGCWQRYTATYFTGFVRLKWLMVAKVYIKPYNKDIISGHQVHDMQPWV